MLRQERYLKKFLFLFYCAHPLIMCVSSYTHQSSAIIFSWWRYASRILASGMAMTMTHEIGAHIRRKRYHQEYCLLIMKLGPTQWKSLVWMDWNVNISRSGGHGPYLTLVNQAFPWPPCALYVKIKDSRETPHPELYQMTCHMSNK